MGSDFANTAQAPVDPLVGAQLGEYIVQRPLGAGGMGVVYEGVQPVIGKPVAIKVLQAELAANPEEAQRLLTEARAVNAIRHRGIVDIFSFGQLPDGRHYLVMELLEGCPLDQVIAERAPLDPIALVAVLDEVLDALAAAHSAGVIHRDLKPNNVFLVTPPHGAAYVKLLDFGLAKQGLAGKVTPQTRTDMVVGTPHYMAPEQARGQPVSPATDIYAAGCMTFEMATGRVPFDGATPLEVVSLHLTAPPPKLASLINNVSFELEELVQRMLRKEPGERPQSARLLRGELRRLKDKLHEGRTSVYAGEAPGPGSVGLPTPSPLDSLVSRRRSVRKPSADLQGLVLEPTLRRPSANPVAPVQGRATGGELGRPSAGAAPKYVVGEPLVGAGGRADPTTRHLPVSRPWHRRPVVLGGAGALALCVVGGLVLLRTSATMPDDAPPAKAPPLAGLQPGDPPTGAPPGVGPPGAGPPTAGPPNDGPPTVGPPGVGPPGVGPPSTGPPTVGPPAVGPPAVGPPAVGPPAVGPPVVGPVVNPPAEPAGSGKPGVKPTKQPVKVSKEGLTARVDKYLIPLLGRETRNEPINAMSLAQLKGIKARIDRATAEERLELAAELAEWERQHVQR